MKMILTQRVDLEIEIDPMNPDHTLKAIAWMRNVADQKIEAPDASLGVFVDVRKPSEMVRRKD